MNTTPDFLYVACNLLFVCLLSLSVFFFLPCLWINVYLTKYISLFFNMINILANNQRFPFWCSLSNSWPHVHGKYRSCTVEYGSKWTHHGWDHDGHHKSLQALIIKKRISSKLIGRNLNWGKILGNPQHVFFVWNPVPDFF